MNRLFGNISEVLRLSTVRSSLEPLIFFRQLSDKQQMMVAGIFQDQKVRKGEIIVSALADPQLVLVMEGEVSVIDLTTTIGTSPSGRLEDLKADTKAAEETIAAHIGKMGGFEPE